MADKTVGELVQAQSVQPSDLFVLEQNGVAKKLTGQTLENWLLSFADGHGGIQSIEQISSEGLVDRYRILLADQTAVFFNVTNGRAIASIVQKSQQNLERVYEISFNDGSVESFTVTDGRSVESIQLERSDGLDDFYIINYNDKTTSSFVVHNGAKGDPGTNMYIWIKYASQEPSADSSSIGDLPDNWIGVYSGPLSTAPEDWTEYKWFEIKGQKGDTGDAATLQSAVIEYLVSDSGTIVPSGSWSVEIPVVSQGKYLWTRVTLRFNTGDPVIAYSVAYAGMDGTGLVNSVNGVAPNAEGNVSLTAANISAAPALESTEYSGCYYRTVDGVTEWINPPMVAGVEYRTTERYNGKEVYAKAINLGTLPASGDKSVSYSSKSASIVSITATAISTSGTQYPFPSVSSSGAINGIVSASRYNLFVTAFLDMSSFTGFAIVRYTKD